jgi:hypothetical protein
MVNIDQTNIYLVPMAKKQTWKKQGKREMVQIGVEDKHAIKCVVSCITNGNLIPFKLFSRVSNHWSNLHTCQQFVKMILILYF